MLWKPTVRTKFVVVNILSIVLISCLDGKLQGVPHVRGQQRGGGVGGREVQILFPAQILKQFMYRVL